MIENHYESQNKEGQNCQMLSFSIFAQDVLEYLYVQMSLVSLW